MPDITPRLPATDWSSGMRRHWLNNDPSATHVFNACSLMVPQAERFFINAVRNMMQMQCANQLPADLNRSIKDFLAQEAAHTSQHRQCNAILESFGWTSRAQQAANWFANQAQQRISPLNQLALVCGCEHWTAVIGLHLLEKPPILAAADSGMALLWSWHAAEEIEHRAVCFDLYLAVGGGWLRRVLALPPVTAVCAVIYFWLLFSLLRQDGCLRPSRLMATLRSLFRFFFGQAGMAWAVLRSGLAWLRPSFHPGCEERIPVLEQWINQHQDQFRGV